MNSAPDFLRGLQDPASGGFRSSAASPATLMGTAYCVLGLEFSGALSSVAGARIGSFLKAAQQPDGYFRDASFRLEDMLDPEHDLPYFQEETTAFCLQALDALGQAPPPAGLPESWSRPQGLVSYLSSFSWKNPWLDSNRVMFALSRLCLAAERQGQSGLLPALDGALDWLDAQQSEKTGLWHGAGEAGLSNAMAASVHFTFFYTYRRRPLRFAERIIDSCLSLQAAGGLFGGRVVGHPCFDYDALQLLRTASSVTPHRQDDIEKAVRRAASALETLQNRDGGYADAKKARFLFGRPQPSSAFSTWFRLMTKALADPSDTARIYRSLPFLGYRPS